MRVRLPGVTSAAAVRGDVVGGDTLEVAAEYGAFEGAVEVVGWKLSHRLPFTLPSDDGSGGSGGASRVKFSKKTATLTLVFDADVAAAAGPD